MDKEFLIEKLEDRINLINDFQRMARETKTHQPQYQTVIGGNARKEELKHVISLLKEE